MTNASECHRDAVFVCGGDRFVVFDRSAETGNWCQACARLLSLWERLGEGAKLESQKIAGPDPSTRGARVSIEPGVERSGTPGTNRTKRTSPRSGRQRNHVALSPAPRAESDPGAYAPGFMLPCAPRTVLVKNRKSQA